MKYYVDTCIFLNVWKGEVGPDPGRPFHESSDEFLEKQQARIAISDVVLFELQRKLPEETYAEKREILMRLGFVRATEREIEEADRIETEEGFIISHADALHLTLARAHGLALVTRDRLLKEAAERRGVRTLTPA